MDLIYDDSDAAYLASLTPDERARALAALVMLAQAGDRICVRTGEVADRRARNRARRAVPLDVAHELYAVAPASGFVTEAPSSPIRTEAPR